MSIGNEFHILGPWNSIEFFLIFVLQVWGRQESEYLSYEVGQRKSEKIKCEHST